ncbi:MAG: alpha/beta hydrolase [Rhodospirillales bacterium]|nr:alpha/beta hydrolase [Rhodospirillales bacterium]
MSTTEPLATAPQRLPDDDGAFIAYHRTPGLRPGVVFLTGYMSDMTGQKALRLEEHCRSHDRAFVRFDYFGHGASFGAFTDGTIGRWADDAIRVLDQLTDGPQVLVGSSLGGWIMLLAARARPQRIAGLLGVAAAPDFTEDLILPVLSPGERRTLERDGVVPMFSPYDPQPTPVAQRLLVEAREHLVLRQPIALQCPVRLIHGMRDPDVPWKTALRLADCLVGDDIEITLVKAGDHRLSTPGDLDRLCDALDLLLRRIEASPHAR